MIRLSYRKVQAGMRAYDVARGHPEILAIVKDWEPAKRLGHPASMATTCGWGYTPKAGFVKVVSAQLDPPGGGETDERKEEEGQGRDGDGQGRGSANPGGDVCGTP